MKTVRQEVLTLVVVDPTKDRESINDLTLCNTNYNYFLFGTNYIRTSLFVSVQMKIPDLASLSSFGGGWEFKEDVTE